MSTTTLAPPRPRKRRWLRRTLVALAVLLVLFLLLLFLLLWTNLGARTVFSLVLPRLPVTIGVDRVDGRLAGPLTIEGLSFESAQADLVVGRFQFDIDEWELIGKTIRITELQIEDVRVVTHEAAPATGEPESERREPSPPPENLPDILLDLAELDDAEILLPDSSRVHIRRVRLDGSLEEYHLQVEGSAEGPQIPVLAFRLAGTGDLQQFGLDTLRVDGMGGSVTATADVAWSPEIVWETRVAVRDIDPSLAPTPAAKEWPGALGFDLATEGGLTDLGVEATFAITDLGGALRELPVSGAVRGEVHGTAARVDTLHLGWGTLAITADGSVDENVQARFTLGAKDLAELDPRLAGRVELSGHGDGPRDAVALHAEGVAIGVAAPGTTMDSVGFVVDGNTDLAQPFNLAVVLRNLQAGGNQVDSVLVRARGTQDEHSLTLAGGGMKATTALLLSGGLRDSTWTGSLDSLRVVHPLAGVWQLAEPAGLQASAAGGALDSLVLVSGDARMAVGGSGRADGSWEGALRIEALDLDRFAVDLPEGTRFTGLLRGTAAFSGSGPKALGQAAFAVDVCSLQVTDPVPATFAFPELALETTIDEAALSTDARFSAEREGAPALDFEAAVRIPGFAGADSLPSLPLEGTLTAHMPDLALLEGAMPKIRGLKGRLQADFEVQGTVGAPVLPGRFTLSEGALQMPEFGVALQAIEVTAVGDAAGGFELDGSAQAGEGTLSISGRTPAIPTSGNPLTAKLESRNALLMNSPEMTVIMDSDLDVRATRDTVWVTGEITIPKANLELLETPPAAVAPSNDVILIGPVEEEPPPPAIPSIDVRLNLGEEVFFRGLNFATRIEGSLRVKQVGLDPGEGTGEFRLVDGYYQAYGQDLRIDPGRVVFSGPLVNPGMDVTAYRLANDGTEAGVKVVGTAEILTVTLYTDPAGEQRDAISYIMTGRPLSGANGEDQAKVADAAAVIGSNVLTSQMGSKVGLDEARVEGDSAEDASLVVGKYINPRLFVSYGMGLFERTSSFRARYFMSPKWSVQTETGTATGADVLYQIETGN